jgi:hypothetical protein
MANNPSSASMHSAAKTMSNSVRRSEQIKKMREKIKKRSTKENVSDQVE